MRALPIIRLVLNTAVRWNGKEIGRRSFDFQWHIARRMPVQFDSAYRTGLSEPANVIQINAPRGF
jgi:hypothetical protein